jgi:triacylglycerol lipase
MTGTSGPRGRRLSFLSVVAVLLGAWLVLPGAETGAQDPFGERDGEAVPVLLVPGWGDHAPDLEPFVRRMVDAGWPASRVSALTFRDPVGSNQAHAGEVGRAVEILLSLTGAERVDIVAHSMGGLAVRYYLQFEGGKDRVRRVVFLGTPHRGTVAAMLAWGDGGREMVPGSDFLNRLNDGDAVPDGVEVLAIRTAVDLRVIPGSSAMLPGARNLEICCPTHPGMVEDDGTFDVVAHFLRADAEQLAEPDDSIPLRTPRGERSRR